MDLVARPRVNRGKYLIFSGWKYIKCRECEGPVVKCDFFRVFVALRRCIDEYVKMRIASDL